MSEATNVLLTCAANEENAIAELSSRLEHFSWYMDHLRGGPLVEMFDVTMLAATVKTPEATVYLAAFRQFDLSEFLSALRNVAWRCPKQVQLFIKGYWAWADGFTETRDFEGVFKQLP